MRFLYLHQHFTTPKGGSGIRSYKMARALVAAGHQVVMVCGSYAGGDTGLSGSFHGGKRRGMVDGIDVIEFDLAYANRHGFTQRALTFLRYALGASWIALTEPADRVIASSTPLTAAIPGIVARWMRGLRFIFEVRDLWPELPRAMGVIRNPLMLGMLGLLERTAYHAADKLIALSPGIESEIVAKAGANAAIVMIPNGCDLDIFGSAAPWRPEGVGADQLLAVFAGTHGIANGLDAVLDAAAELKRRGRDDIRILLIGDGREKAGLLTRANAEGLSNVIFADPVGKAELAGLLAGADVGLQLLADVPAFYDGTSPNKFFDYLAAGLPVLNNYPGWLAAMIEMEQCGFAIQPRNPLAFADSLEQAADDRAALRHMGQNARALAERDFARDDLARKWVDWVAGPC